MSQLRRTQIKTLLEKALDLPVDARSAFLNDASGGDVALRRELENLLAHAGEASEFYESPVDEASPSTPEENQSYLNPTSLPNRRVAHYDVLEKLGGGGMGVVYRACDTRLDRTVALKFLSHHLSSDDQAKYRFVQEAKAASSLDHPNIGYIHEVNETADGRLFIAMAYYDGETLKAKLARGPLPIEQAVDYAGQIVTGLAKAHAAGIIHRDIKPANVMVTNDGLVKIVDFGLAKMAGESGLTKTGSTMGTVSYMSPEQASGETIDWRTDIWSLGAMMYEMLAGRRPFPGRHEHAVIHAILFSDPRPLRELRAEIPERLAALVHRMLDKDRENRPQHTADLLAELGLETGTHSVWKRRHTRSVWRRITSFLRRYIVTVLPFLTVVAEILYLLDRPLAG